MGPGIHDVQTAVIAPRGKLLKHRAYPLELGRDKTRRQKSYGVILTTSGRLAKLIKYIEQKYIFVTPR